MDFAHVGPKKFNLSEARLLSIETIEAELQNTELVCVLCHRDRTFRRQAPRHTKNLNAENNRRLVLEAKARPCAQCGASYPHWKMDLDHLPGTKKLFRISSVMNKQRNYLRKLRLELDKCQVLCALCHRRKTLGCNDVL